MIINYKTKQFIFVTDSFIIIYAVITYNLER
jgi:hypothetical protein